MKRLKKELFIFIVIFLICALGMHFDIWISSPLAHIANLVHHPMPYHPLLYVSIIYLILIIIRVIFNIILKFFRKK